MSDPELHAYQIASKPLPSSSDMLSLSGGIVTEAMVQAVSVKEPHSRGIFIFSSSTQERLAISKPYHNWGRSYAEDHGISFDDGPQRLLISYDSHGRKNVTPWHIDLPRTLAPLD